MTAKGMFRTLFLVAFSFVAFPLVYKIGARARILPQNAFATVAELEAGKTLENLKVMLHSLDETSCDNVPCSVLDSHETHANVRTFFADLRILLDDTSSETMKMRLQKRDEASANNLLYFLIHAASPDDFESFVQKTLLHPADRDIRSIALPRQKRDIMSWISEEASYLENKLENMDWKTVVKRAGQVYTVVQAARSVSDPSQMAMQAGLAIGKMMLTEAVEDKMSEWWHEIIE